MNTYTNTLSNIRDLKITMIQNELKVFNICMLSSEVIELKNVVGERVVKRLKDFIA